MSGKKSLQILM